MLTEHVVFAFIRSNHWNVMHHHVSLQEYDLTVASVVFAYAVM
jgi:hypothetical protein